MQCSGYNRKDRKLTSHHTVEICRFIETIGHGVKYAVIVMITYVDFVWTNADDWA